MKRYLKEGHPIETVLANPRQTMLPNPILTNGLPKGPRSPSKPTQRKGNRSPRCLQSRGSKVGAHHP